MPGWVFAVPAAIGAAASFGTAGVLQHRATHQAPKSRPLSPGLLFDLIRIQGFRSGILLGALGFTLQVVALRYGPLILVQPMLVTGVLFYLLVASWLEHRRLDRTMIAGVLLAIAGLSAFLLTADPGSGSTTTSFESAAALPLGLGLVTVTAVCIFVSQRITSELRALPLALATAVFYGTTAGLIRSLIAGTDSWGWGLFSHWELYAVIVIGPAGFVLNQNAFQSGLLGSVALATITVGDPIVAIGIGLAWLGESIAGGVAVVGEVIAFAVMAAGVALLAHRAQHLAEQMQATAAAREEDR